MTQQSGQGAASSEPQQPPARHAYEGIVLPADGSAPLMPGTTGDHAAPPVGSPWGDPWGPAPSAPAPPAPGGGETWGAPYQDATEPSAPPRTGMPLPPEGTPPTRTPLPPEGAGQGYAPTPGRIPGQDQDPLSGPGPIPAEGGTYPPQPPYTQHQAQAQPQGGYEGQGHSQGGYEDQGHPQGGYEGQRHPQHPQQTPQPYQPYQQQAHQEPHAQYEHHQQQQPHAQHQQPSYRSQGQPQSEPQGQPQGESQGRPRSMPLPPAAPSVPLPPVDQGAAHGGHFPSPGQYDAYGNPGSGQHAGPAHTAYQGGQHAAGAARTGGTGGGRHAAAAPMPTGPDAEATQFIAPVADGAPGALPPERPADGATQFLGRAADVFPGGAAHGVPDDNAPTQFIAPVTDGGAPAGPAAQSPSAGYGVRPGAPGDRQPPAEFDSLFRREPEPEGPASTQQMPRFQEPGPGPAAEPTSMPQPDAGGRRRGRGGSKTPLLAAVGVGIAVLGVGAGALLSGGGGGGGDGEEAKDDSQPLASTAAPKRDKPSPTADPAKKQAVALDKLLADSNNSRETVIGAVRDVGKCTNLKRAATDLRAAARQRDGLVGRLSGLSVDELPANSRLTAALNKAWKASASADNHYAAWADQVARKKGCRKGHARQTSHSAAGNRASGEATQAKQQAATLWNAIAQKHGLTKRDKAQL
ncbi:hypothetical protein [Streptomyces sp. NPDC017941]|uniref:hypothetical protein n=1 Tax=Streptomyces sp. NPDC017941 TaxID=3365018 RepID=UPI0037A036B5